MNPVKQRWPLAEALDVAERIRDLLEPDCARIEIAGSIRRWKSDVGDIELVYVPKIGERPIDLLYRESFNCAEEEIDRLLKSGVITKRLSARGAETWGKQNKLAVVRSCGIPLDLFETTEQNWFMALVIRTGPKEQNIRLIESAKRRGYQLHAYGTFSNMKDGGSKVAVMSERQVFEICGQPYLEPWERH